MCKASRDVAAGLCCLYQFLSAENRWRVGACWGREGATHRRACPVLTVPKTLTCGCWDLWPDPYGCSYSSYGKAERSVAKYCSQLDAVLVSAVKKFQAALSLFANLLSLLIRGLSFALQKLQPSSTLIICCRVCFFFFPQKHCEFFFRAALDSTCQWHLASGNFR